MKFQVVNIWQDDPPQWSGQHGTFDAYRLNLLAEDGSKYGNVQLSKKAGNQPPAEGSYVEGEIQQTNHGPKLKLAAPQGGGGGGQRPAGGGGSGGGGGFPPHVQASIVFQHAQKCAIDVVNSLPGGPPAEAEAYLAKVRDVAASIAKDVGRVWEQHGGPARFGAPAAGGGAQAQPAAPQGGGGDFGQPPAQGGFGQAPGGGGFGAAPADDDIPF